MEQLKEKQIFKNISSSVHWRHFLNQNFLTKNYYNKMNISCFQKVHGITQYYFYYRDIFIQIHIYTCVCIWLFFISFFYLFKVDSSSTEYYTNQMITKEFFFFFLTIFHLRHVTRATQGKGLLSVVFKLAQFSFSPNTETSVIHWEKGRWQWQFGRWDDIPYPNKRRLTKI